MAIAYWYGLAAKKLAEAGLNWDSDTIKCALMTSDFTPDQDTQEFWGDISANEAEGTGYTAGGKALTTSAPAYDAAGNTVKLDAEDVVWANSTITATHAVIYKDTGNPATSPLLGYVDFGGSVVNYNGDFTIQWDETGVLKLSVAGE